jgi:hypothetical protein
LNHEDVSDLEVVALERVLEFRIYNSKLDESSKLIFPVVALFPEFPVVLNSQKSTFAELTVVLSVAQIMLH